MVLKWEEVNTLHLPFYKHCNHFSLLKLNIYFILNVMMLFLHPQIYFNKHGIYLFIYSFFPHFTKLIHGKKAGVKCSQI